jgi:hypothetical protein
MHKADERAHAASGEVLKVRRRVRRTLRQKVLAGTVAMRPAYGTRMKPLVAPDGTVLPSGVRYLNPQGRLVGSGMLEIHPEELPWVLRMYEWAADGKSFDWIARTLTAAGVPTKTGNNSWGQNTVRGILQNPLYKGEMRWGHQATLRDSEGHKYLEVRPPSDPGRLEFASPLGVLVAPDLWEKANRPRAARQREPRKPKHPRRVFDHMVFCARCGRKMYPNNTSRPRKDGTKPDIWNYVCSTRPGALAVPGYGPPCRHVNLLSEKHLLMALAEIGTPGAVGSVRVRSHVDEDLSHRRGLIEQQIATLEAERQRMVTLAIKGLIDEAQLKMAKTANDEALAAARQQRARLTRSQPAAEAELEGHVNVDFAQFVELLRDPLLPTQAKAAAVRRLGIHRIHIDRPRVEVEIVR